MAKETDILLTVIAQSLAGVPGAAQKLTDGDGSSQKTEAIGKHKMVYICGTGAFYVAFGSDSVEAKNTDMYWPANTVLHVWTGENTHVAILRATGSATSVTVTPIDFEVGAMTPPLPGQYGA